MKCVSHLFIKWSLQIDILHIHQILTSIPFIQHTILTSYFSRCIISFSILFFFCGANKDTFNEMQLINNVKIDLIRLKIYKRYVLMCGSTSDFFFYTSNLDDLRFTKFLQKFLMEFAKSVNESICFFCQDCRSQENCSIFFCHFTKSSTRDDTNSSCIQ